jgi:general secretion pathway protein D
MIAALDSTSAAGSANELVTRVVRLQRGSAHEVVAFVRQLYPETITLLPSNVPRTIIVRAPPGDIDQVEETLKSISGTAISDDRVAIIPLTQSAPERVAIQLAELYKQRLPAGSDLPTIIALERQQALLVATKDSALMEGLRQLTKELDRESADEPTLRIIPLQHLAADEIAQRLNTIFGTGGGGQQQGAGAVQRGGTARSSDRSERAPSLFPPGQLAVPGRQTPLQDPDAGTEAAPGFSVPGSVTQRGSRTAGAIGERFPGSTVGAGAAGATGTTQGVRIVPDVRSNSIMLFSTFAIYRRIRDVLRALDVPQSQVVIEATVVEVDLNDRLEKGVQFYLSSPHVSGRTSLEPTILDPGRPGGFLRVGADFGKYRVDAVLNALQQVTTVKVISSPYVAVLDGKTARLVIGDQIPYTTRSQTSQNTGNVTVTQEVEIKDTGIILEVTPKINSNNSVALKINQTVSTPSPTAQAGNTTPVIATRSVDSNVLVQSGRTILLGGLIQDRLEQTENGIPLLRTIPVLGDFFKSDDDRTRRVELVVMITPRVSRQISQIEEVTRLIRSQLHTRDRRGPLD